MSRAYQCDRCKKCFSVDDLRESDRFISFGAYYEFLSKHDISSNTFSERRYEQHFCPRCTRAFERFMETSIFINNPYVSGLPKKEFANETTP